MISKLYKYIATMISVLIIICIIFYIAKPNNERGHQMYIEVFNRNLEHVTNITDVKYNVVRRVFDSDTASFEGVTNEDVSGGFIFVLCEDNGKYIYSGFMKAITIKNNTVSFKGIDFKSIYDTEILLDYSQSTVVASEFTTTNIYTKVSNLVIDQYPSANYPISLILNVDDNDTLFIANYIGQYLITNAKSFLKVYLAYFQNYIDAKFDRNTKTIVIEFKDSIDSMAIILDDFIFEQTLTDVNVNSTVATIKVSTVDEDGKYWIKSTKSYYDSLPADQKHGDDSGYGINGYPVALVENYPFGYAVHVVSNPDYPDKIGYWQVANASIPRPITLPYRVYYLGKDNNIYEGDILISNKYLPVKTKIFEDEFFNKAQLKAITELVNSRYNENIILTNTNSPYDLKELDLYYMINVYDKNNVIKQLPVSEIEMSNDAYRVKLGFKRTFFTEVIKHANN